MRTTAIIAFAICLTACSSHNDIPVIEVNMQNAINTNNSQFEGWGTSLCWWANRIGYSNELSQSAANLFYGENGLRLNIMRYNIGGGDDPTHHHIKRTDSEVPGWLSYDSETNSYSYNYLADSNQLNVTKLCMDAAGQDAYLEVFSNSPPYFWTVSGCSSGNTDTSKDNLRSECYTQFANYLANVADYMQNNIGLKIKSISPMNEASTNFWWAYSDKQEGCHFDAGKSQSNLLVETAKALNEKKLNNIIIAACDETGPRHQLNALNKLSDSAHAVVKRISTHTYDTSGRYALGHLAKEYPNIWMSEVDGGATVGDSAGEMGAPLWLAQRIIDDINGLEASAWVMWQVIDNHISTKGHNGNKDKGMVDLNKGYWGVAVANHDNNEIILTQKYYGFGQFTRYIRPGSTIIKCGDNAIASYNPQKSELAIVAINKSADEQQFVIDMASFAKIGRKARVIRTSGSMENGEHWSELKPLKIKNKKTIVDLKSYSITTFIIDY